MQITQRTQKLLGMQRNPTMQKKTQKTKNADSKCWKAWTNIKK